MMVGFFYKDLKQSKVFLCFVCGFVLIISVFLFAVSYFIRIGGPEEGIDGFIFYALAFYLAFLLVDWAVSDGFSGDDRNLWQSFAMATPGTMKAQIQSKFCLTLFLNICMLVLCDIVDAIGCLLAGDMSGSAALVPVILICWNMMKTSIHFPFIFRYGTKHGQNAKQIFFLCVVGIIAIYLLYGDISWLLNGNVLEKIRTFLLEGNGVWIMEALPCVAAAMYYGSYRVCLKVYRKGLENYE